MNPPWPNRLRPAVAGLRRFKKLWRVSVERVEHFFFIIGMWVCVKRILEESRRCRPHFTRGECFGFRRPQDVGKTVLTVGPGLVKLFQRRKVKLPVAASAACRGRLCPAA